MITSFRDAYVSGEFAIAFDGKVSFFPGGTMQRRPSSVHFPSERLGNKAIELDDVVVIFQNWWGFCKLPVHFPTGH
jgi:hypothetical protein